MDKIAAVADQVPVSREATQPMDRFKAEQAATQYLVGWMWTVDHLPLRVMSYDRCPAEPLQNADLDFLRTQRKQTIETGSETFERLAGQSDDQVRMDMDPCFLAEESEVCLELVVVLSSTDQFPHLWIKRLDADLELERTRRELRDQFSERIRQSIGDHLKMQEHSLLETIEEELQDGTTDAKVEIERSVDKFELQCASIEQFLDRFKKPFQLYQSYRNLK